MDATHKRATRWGLGALIAGIIVGTLLVGPWVGGVIGGIAGLVLGSVIGIRIKHPLIALAATVAGIGGVLFAIVGAAGLLNPVPPDFPPLSAAPIILADIHSDSVTTTAGTTYPAGPLRRFFAGDLNRDLWEIPVRLPVLDLEATGGGLEPSRLTGGEQTVGLRFLGQDGLGYDFRLIVKNPAPALPRWMRHGAIAAALDDQMAAQFPFGAVVVARLLDAARIESPRPIPFVMPQDPRLGPYQATFAGRVGLFAIHPNERVGDRPGFAGYTRIVNSDSVYDDLRHHPENTFDDRYFLRIRLVDLLVGDWDRHSGQWRWGLDGNQWRAIPVDRDWAFARMDGVVGGLARWLLPHYVGFSDEFPEIERLASQADHVDHRVLNRLGRPDFLAVAREVQVALADSVIEAAVNVLPAPVLAVERERLVTALKARRDHLVDFSAEYYRYLARKLRVSGFATSDDVVDFDQVSDSGTRVRLRSGGRTGPVRFERYIDARDTRELHLYLDATQDQLVGNQGLPFKVSIDTESW